MLARDRADHNRHITPRDLDLAFGGGEAWWIRQRPRMVRAGLLVKIGRKFYGNMARIDQAIADPEVWTDGR